ncbi:MAG: endo alpha-1,4 polygalactosaminidase [Pseudomonadota bacterium]
MTMPFLYQLQNADYASLQATDFRVAVIDPDDSALSAEQVGDLQTSQDKLLYAYTSIGEAESYRDYWEDSWTITPPDYVLGENANWEGNFRVEFWDTDWQAIIYGRIDELLAKGYDGAYLDIVDGYTVDEVIAAYPGSDAELRQAMIDFVIGISEYAKAQDPDFAIVPQNAVGLLGLTEGGPDSGANTAYLDAIDGLGVEDLWYNDDVVSDWTQGDLDYIALAKAAGKFVLATSYPTIDASQKTFIADAIQVGLIPFAAERDLSGLIDTVNDGIEAAMEGGVFDAPWVGIVSAGIDLTVDQFAVQYSNLDAAQIAASPYNVLIVEGKPGDAAAAELTDAEVAALVSGGVQMIGYVSVGQSDDARPYWDASWTDDGTDIGTPTDAAPSWLGEQAESYDAAIVEFWNPTWQALVIDQVTELATRGYSGIFLDNMLSYYEIASLRGELGTEQSKFYAQEMMSFVKAVSEAGSAINPDFLVIPNGAPYIISDAGYASGSAEATAYLDAIDAVMAESFFGLATGYLDEAALDAFQVNFADQGVDVLALEYATDADAIAAFAADAEARGFSASVAADMALDELATPLADVAEPLVLTGTDDADRLFGADGDDQLSGKDGADLLEGGAGDDVLTGGRGKDELQGGAGSDELRGNKGGDHLDGGAGSDALFGGRGQDDLSGGKDNDQLSGGRGHDELFGNAGDDLLKGHRGHDLLIGGDGADRLVGGKGGDELYGGEGADQFVFGPSSGWDVIGDFDVMLDMLVVRGVELVEVFQTDEALVLNFENSSHVELTGLAYEALAEIDIAYL